jgi:subtilisin family serine protease
MKRSRSAVFSLFVLAAFLTVVTGGPLSAPGGGRPAPGTPAFVEDEVLVKFQPSARQADKAAAKADVKGSKVRSFKSGAEHWKVAHGLGVTQAIEKLKRNPHVAYAEPNYILTADVVPNDPRFPELYGMLNTGQTGGTADADIDADQAWGVSRGSHDVIVGIIDTGIDYNHPDIAANIWTNPGEIPGNLVDDDGNGFVDDLHGYDFVNNDPDPFDDNGHGTHCSGTIGGVGNNGVGVAGVNWQVSLMGLKFLSGAGSGSTADAVRAVEYSTMMGVDLTSNSWGGGGFSQTLYDAVAAAGAANIAFVAAAGNDGTDNDVSPHYPSNYDLPNVISVAATDHNDAKASFSNWGATTVDLGAPGVNILSTLPGNSYGQLSGTSMATPHVSGVCALIRSVAPGVPVAQLKNILLSSVDHIASMNGRVVSNGRLNAFFAIAEPDDVPPGAIADLATSDAGSNTMVLNWTATGDDGAAGTANSYDVRYSASPINDGNFAAATRAGNAPTPSAAGSAETMEVHGLAPSTTYFFAVKAADEWGNPGPISNIATGLTLPPPVGSLTPGSISESLLTGQTADHTASLANIGPGTLDFTIPTPSLGEPLAVAPEPLLLGKGEEDPRSGPPVIEGSGGPDAFGYRWSDSDEPGGPAFAWMEISGTGTPVAATGDDSTSPAIALGFDFPFYGTFFNSVRVSSNGFLSFTSSSTAYQNQPLPNSGAPDNLVAPFWDDLDPGGATHIYFQSFGNRAVIEWTGMPRYQETGSALTFQAILETSGSITYQYLILAGTLNSATVGIQNAAKTDGLAVAFNQSYLHDNLAVRIAAIPQWLSVTPTSGRLHAGESIPLAVHIDAAGLEGGTYPGNINVQTNDPDHPVLTLAVSLHVIGAPDAAVQPASLAFGDSFLGLPKGMTLTVANIGTDTLHVASIDSSAAELVAAPSAFDVPPHGSRSVAVTWTPSALGPFAGSLTVHSDDAGESAIVVPATGNAIPAPVVVTDPTSFDETLFSGNQVNRTLRVTNAGGSNLVLTAAADQGTGALIVAPGEGALGSGGPDTFGYRWRDSDAAGGPAFNFIDISSTGTPIAITGDDSLSGALPLGMTFPFYGSNVTQFKACTNGYITFDTAATNCAFTNGTLPTSGTGNTLPGNSIAMFWDDLHFRGVQKARYLYDGTRFIIQYTDADRVTTGSHLTFQAQLYPDGRILVMYQTMNSPLLNSATIGIQNGPRTVALQVVANANYMHNNLALQINRVPDWLTVTPAGATVPPGEFRDFNVRFDSTGRPGGTLTGRIVLGTNIPGTPQVQVPATLHVIGAPQAAVQPTAFSYGTVFAGYPALTSFIVVNNGTDVLNVSDISTTDPSLVVEDSPGSSLTGGGPQILAAFPLTPGGARLFTLRWNPAAPGTLNALVQVHSDDPVNPVVNLAVTGTAIAAPIAEVTPTSFTESANAGAIINRPMLFQNHGGSNLTFSVGVRALGGTPVPVYDEMDLKKGEDDPRPGVQGAGGPDLFGYRWKDSDEPGGPAFAWTDIAGVGTPIAGLTGDDQNAGPVAIGFPFPFYGGSFSSVRVTTNGWLSFTNTTTDFSNDPVPNTGAPENLIAPFWDDLDFRGAVHAHSYNDGTRFIVQWTDVDRHSTTELPSPAHLTFQAILYPNGRIVFQYLTVSGFLTSATIGTQNATKNDGLNVSFNTTYVHNGLAIAIFPPLDFLSVSPSSGTVPPGGSATLGVRIDATNLVGGDYLAGIDLTTNDPARGLITVPVSLHVTGIPDIDAVPAALSFPTTFVGFSAALPLSLRNPGTDVLHIASVSVSGDYSVSGITAPAAIPAGGAVPLTVTFTPTGAGPRPGSITLGSDDPDESPLVIGLAGNALVPPAIGVDPDAIATALPPAGSRTKVVTLSNTGGSDLVWSLGTVRLSTTVPPGTYLALGKGEEDPRVGILGSGGPDAFGYVFKDSDEPGGPTFAWTDISGVGTPIAALTADDQNSGPIPIGFPFPFYGNAFTSVRVATNGWLSFTSSSTAYSNQPLPNNASDVPENLLAAFWDDLHFRGAVHAHSYNDGTRFIVQYTNVDRFTTGSHLTFQVILYPSGRIVYQYLTVSGVLDSATVGIQNQAKDDGLQVAFNAAYLHDNLAIEIKPIPDWLQASPSGGTLAAGGTTAITVALNAAGLEDGLHEGRIDIASNDPYRPAITVPVSLKVGLVAPTYLNFDPDALNLAAMGTTVKMVIELPPAYDPHDIVVGSVRLNDTVPALPSPIAYSDENGNGIQELVVRFDRQAVEATLGQGSSVPVTIQGEVLDTAWFRGTTTVRVIRPRLTHPNSGGYFTQGMPVTIGWEAAQGSGNIRHELWLSRDLGATWEPIAANLTGTSYVWTVGGPATNQGLIRVVARDNQGVMGYDTSDAAFTIASGTLMPPLPVGDTLELSADAADVILSWKRPTMDATHGPAAQYRVLRSFEPQGPWVQIGSVSTETLRDPLAGPAGATVVYYRVVAGNAAGDAAE